MTLQAPFGRPEAQPKVTVLVPEPHKRGMSAGQFEKFFKDHCGTIIFEEKDDAKPICLPNKLARRCARENLINPGRIHPYEPNLHAINDFVIKPETLKKMISYAEHLNPNGKAIDFFISHHWSEDFGEFVQSVLRHAMSVAATLGKHWQDIVYWCCAFANNQHEVSLGEQLEQSPFHLALASDGCRGTVLNLNRMASALFRVWCVYEAFLTHALGKKFVVNTCQGPISEAGYGGTSEERDIWTILVFELLQEVDVEQAQATEQSDKVKIMEAIKNLQGRGIAKNQVGAAALNAMLKEAVAEQAMFILVRKGKTDLVRQALALGVDPNKKDQRGIRPLTYAVALLGEYHGVTRLLLDSGADARAAEAAKAVIDMFGGEEGAIKIVAELQLDVHSDAVAAAWAHYAKWNALGWIVALKRPHRNVRRHAANALGNLREHVEPAVPALVAAALRDPDKDVKQDAVKALRKLGKHIAPTEMASAVAKLGMTALFDSDIDVRENAAEALIMLGEFAWSAVPTLTAALGVDRLTKLADYAAPVVPAREAASDPGIQEIQCRAAWVLGQLEQLAAPAVPALGEALRDSSATVRHYAAWALSELGELAAPAVPALRAALCDSYNNVQIGACFALDQVKALSELGELAASAACALGVALRSSDADTRTRAAEALHKLGEHAVPALPALAEVALRDSDTHVRKHAVDALRKLGEHATLAVPVLEEGLRHSAWGVRWRAAVVLARLGKIAGPALPALRAASRDSDHRVRVQAHLARIQVLINRVEYAKSPVALLAEFWNNPATEGVELDFLFHVLRNLAEGWIRSAVVALCKRGQQGIVLSACTAVLEDSSSPFRNFQHTAITALDELGELAAPLVPALLRVCEPMAPFAVNRVRDHARSTFIRLGSEALPQLSLPSLVDVALRDPDEGARSWAVDTLHKLGEEAVSAVPALKKGLRDPDGHVQVRAANALRQIRGFADEPREESKERQCSRRRPGSPTEESSVTKRRRL